MITIYLPDARGFWISETKWNDAPAAFASCMNPPKTTYAAVTSFNPIPKSTIDKLNDWRWIGWAGWYGTEANKTIYDNLKAKGLLDGWSYGEYDEIDDLCLSEINERTD